MSSINFIIYDTGNVCKSKPFRFTTTNDNYQLFVNIIKWFTPKVSFFKLTLGVSLTTTHQQATCCEKLPF